MVPIRSEGPASSVASDWRASAKVGGSPGADDPVLSVPAVQVSEVLAHTDLPQWDAVELVNPGDVPAEIGGWFLTDDRSDPKK